MRRLRRALCLWPLLLGAAQPAEAQRSEPLALPSFSIFELSPETVTPDLERKYRAGELAGMRAALEARRAETIASTTDATVKARAKDNRLLYFIVPITFYASRHLFAKETWSEDELKEASELAAFLAWIAGNAELSIAKLDQRAVRSGLGRLRAWFAALVRDNKTLPAMMMLTDDLFYGGRDVDVARAGELTVVASSPIPDTQASFVVLSDGATPEPLILGVLDADGTARWLKRYSAAPLGAIAGAAPHQRGVRRLDGHGYVCWLLASWDFGTEASRIYLDESLDLRFYFLSW